MDPFTEQYAMRGPDGEYPIPVHMIYTPLAKLSPLFDVDTGEKSAILGSFKDALQPATKGLHPWPLVLAVPAKEFFKLVVDTDGLQWWKSEFDKVTFYIHNVEDVRPKMQSSTVGLLHAFADCLEFVSLKEDVYEWAQKNSLTKEEALKGEVSSSYP